MFNTQNITTNYTEFIPANLTFTKLEENDRSNGQLIGYPRYSSNGSESSIEIQLPWIKLITYGVPTINDKTKKYYKTDNDRAHLRLPLDLQNPEVLDFTNKFKALDAIMADPEMAKKLLGKNAKKYKYQPIYREAQVAQVDDDDDSEEDTKKSSKKDKKPTFNKPPYIKLKLDLTWPDSNVKTKVFESLLDTTTNKRTRTKVEISSVDDFANIVRYLSTIRCIIKPFKIWGHPTSKKDPEYGIGWKVVRVEVEKLASNSNFKSSNSDSFIDSDSEDEIPKINKQVDTSNKQVDTITKQVDTININKDDESDDESDDDSSDEEFVMASTNNNTTNKIVEVDSSDDSDEEEVQKPVKQVIKKVANKGKK